ncbi:hypothetical protein COMA2_70112 [Candidatus Nitrospira nitrificans]|uniref:Uncharacterized protein n=1 Tax=Candidatus Nitrospira nitrificans TaxID=1742973 RepID=A0A0S4LRT1_9BACT|nr:hypothetical protein COMA2_70112 [Candidatus Nitrospira nitrificans]
MSCPIPQAILKCRNARDRCTYPWWDLILFCASDPSFDMLVMHSSKADPATCASSQSGGTLHRAGH